MKYLTATGREGRHYVEALELMNKAQDAIEGRKELPAASTGQPLTVQGGEPNPAHRPVSYW